MVTHPVRRLTAVIVAALLAMALGGCGSAAGDADAPTTTVPATTAAWQRVAADLLEDTLAETGIPGGAVEIVREGVRWTHTAGLADLSRAASVSAEDRFAYRSVTKSFTATAVLVLVDEGRLGLDDPLADYVPGAPSADAITVRMLLGMRSGLVNYSATEAFQQALVADPTRVWSDDELLATALAEPLVFPPGTSYQYSNTNTLLLGKVLEALTGQSWWDAVRTAVVEPLDLSTVTYPGGDAFPVPSAVPYQASGRDGEAEELPPVSATVFSAAGGLVGTVSDLSSWAQALGSGALLAPSTAAARLSAPSPTSTDADSPLYDEYGLGLGTLDGWIGHTGVGLGYQALAMYDPATGDSVAIVFNGTGDDPDAPAGMFRELVAPWR